MTTVAATDTVVRFSTWQRLQHGLVILLFGLLLITGLPQKWPYVEASRWLVEQLGGIFAVRWMHRMAGWAFSALVLAHLASVILAVTVRRGEPTMMFAWKDFTDAVHSLRYYLGRTPSPPKFGRFDYRQKFEYWGLVFGSVIMVVTGVILYFPILVSRLLPAELLPAAKVMHSNEALLAMLIVLIWHMYGAHLNPEVYPMDFSMFSGKISKERLKQAHELEYERLYGKE